MAGPSIPPLPKRGDTAATGVGARQAPADQDLLITGKVYDIQSFSVQDGPGIRTTVFEKGCPLSCKWCHSPESQSGKEQLCWFPMRCIGVEKCGYCLDACGNGAIRAQDASDGGEGLRYPEIDRGKCMDCGDCARACASRALFISGSDYTVQEVLDRVMRDRSYFARSGGGVTVSGGECLLQAEFTMTLLRALKYRKIHTAIDTTGYVRFSVLERTLPYTDLYLYDLKHMDPNKHKAGTGVSNEVILENARRLARAGANLWIRIPVIPGYNDSEENIRHTRDFCLELEGAGAGCIGMVQLLPYHRLGEVKYERLGIEYPMQGTDPPKEKTMQKLRALFEAEGLRCRVH